MNAFLSRRGFAILFAAAAFSIVCAEWWIVHSLLFQRDGDVVAVGITLDLVVVIPALYYFMVLRPGKSSPLYLVPCFAACVALAARLIPAAEHQTLLSLKRLSPMLEVLVLAALASRFREFCRSYCAAKSSAVYFTDALFSGFQKALSDRAVFIIAFVEFFLIYFSFAGWFLKPPAANAGQRQFTYHKKSGYVSIMGILLFVLIVETFALHMIVMRWSVLIAWILTVLSLYSALWLVGDYHAIRVHPIIITPERLYLRTGLRWRADIPMENVEGVEIGSAKNPKAPDYLRASILWPRATLILKTPVEIHGLFGRKKKASRIGLSVDDPEALRAALSHTSEN